MVGVLFLPGIRWMQFYLFKNFSGKEIILVLFQKAISLVLVRCLFPHHQFSGAS